MLWCCVVLCCFFVWSLVNTTTAITRTSNDPRTSSKRGQTTWDFILAYCASLGSRGLRARANVSSNSVRTHAPSWAWEGCCLFAGWWGLVGV